MSNRVSYAFNLKGPSLTVDTACYSAMVALHLACQAIQRDEVEGALVGGVNLLISPQGYVGFSRASMVCSQPRHIFCSAAWSRLYHCSTAASRPIASSLLHLRARP